MLNLRFSELAKKSDSPFEAAGVSEDELFRSARIFGLSIQAEPEKWQQALSAAEAELRRACTYGFSEQELKMISSALLISARSVRDGWETVTCDSIAGEIIDALSDLSAFTAPDEDIRSIEAGLAAIMADPDICRRALADAYKTDRVKLTLMGTIAPGVDEKALRSAYSEAAPSKSPPPSSKASNPSPTTTSASPARSSPAAARRPRHHHPHALQRRAREHQAAGHPQGLHSSDSRR